MASHHDGKGTVNSLVTAGLNLAQSTNPFVRSLPVGNGDETEITEAQPPKGQSLDLTKFATSQSPDKPLLLGLTDRVAKLEDET